MCIMGEEGQVGSKEPAGCQELQKMARYTDKWKAIIKVDMVRTRAEEP